MIYLGADHAGFEMKKKIKADLLKQGLGTADLGAKSYEKSDDYPDFAVAVAKTVAGEKDAIGILLCGTGIGVCITANKVKGIRAALCYDTYTAEVARKHNDANVLCLGARKHDIKELLPIVDTFLSQDFEGGRHKRRRDKIIKIEEGIFPE